MKLLFVVENYFPHIGGMEIVFMNLAESFAKQGHEIHIITHKLKSTPSFEIINNVKIHRVNCFHNRYLFTFFSLPKVLFYGKKSDILHTTTFNGAPPAWLASKILKKPCIITIHEVWVNRWHELTDINPMEAKIFNILEKLIYLFKFDDYICVSKSTQNELIKLKNNRIRTEMIYNGIDYSFWTPEKYDREEIRKKLNITNNFVLLYYGRPGVSKGVDYLVNSIPFILKDIPNTKLLMILSKDTTYRKRYDNLSTLIKKLKMEENIIVHNPVPYNDLPNFVKAADCVIVPSLSEGFGFTAAESCAMDVPVIVTDNASLPEVVSGRYILVKPKDANQIAVAVKKIYYGEIEKIKLKKFEWKDSISKYLSIYDKLISEEK